MRFDSVDTPYAENLIEVVAIYYTGVQVSSCAEDYDSLVWSHTGTRIDEQELQDFLTYDLESWNAL